MVGFTSCERIIQVLQKEALALIWESNGALALRQRAVNQLKFLISSSYVGRKSHFESQKQERLLSWVTKVFALLHMIHFEVFESVIGIDDEGSIIQITAEWKGSDKHTLTSFIIMIIIKAG